MSNVQDRVIQRFAELEAQCRAIRLVGRGGVMVKHLMLNQSSSTLGHERTKCHSGRLWQESPHYQRFEQEMKSISNNFVWDRKLDTFRGIFLGAKSDVDGGHLFALQASFSGEIFGGLRGNRQSRTSLKDSTQ